MGLRKLTITEDQLNDLHAIISGARKATTEVKVDKEALQNLLNDHGELLGCFTTEEIFEAERRGGAKDET